MIRNLKVLGLALAAVFAMSAMAAQAAMASGERFHSDEDPTVITASNAGLGNHVFTAQGVPVECETATFAGTQTGSTAEEITVHPTYSNCSVIGVPVTVVTTGCNYILYSETGENTHTSTTDAPVKIECTEGHELYFEAAKCKITIETPQTVRGVTYSNEGTETSKKDIRVTASTDTIKYVAENTAGIGFKCGTLGIELGTHEDATYTGAVTAKGSVDKCAAEECPFVPEGGTDKDAYTEGAPVGIWWQ